MQVNRSRSTVAGLVLLALMQTACPSQSDLDRAAKASRELAHDTVTAEQLIGDFYIAGKISLAKKDHYADVLGKIAVKGKAFNDKLIVLDKKYPKGVVPVDQAQMLRDEVAVISALVADITSDLKLFGGQKAVADLNKHVNTISEVMNK